MSWSFVSGGVDDHSQDNSRFLSALRVCVRFFYRVAPIRKHANLVCAKPSSPNSPDLASPQSASIFDASCAAPSTSSDGGRSSTSPRFSLSSSMLEPTLLILGMRRTNCAASSKLKPDPRRMCRRKAKSSPTPFWRTCLPSSSLRLP